MARLRRSYMPVAKRRIHELFYGKYLYVIEDLKNYIQRRLSSYLMASVILFPSEAFITYQNALPPSCMFGAEEWKYDMDYCEA